MIPHGSRIGRCALALALIVAATLALEVRGDTFQPFPNNSTHSQAAVLAAIANVPATAGTVYDAAGRRDNIQVWEFATLVYTGAVDVSSTLERIRRNDWFPGHPNDGGFFNFRGGASELPNIPRKGTNYYMEFTVRPSMDLDAGTYDPNRPPYSPAMTFPGPMRLLIGAAGEVYFTGDHYGDGPAHLPAYYVNPVPEPATSVALMCVTVVAISRRRRGLRAARA
jgi:hypothetical protein